ncbi:phage tail tube protein [Paenibacillus sp. N1-5-1-14]|uniref:phage tail tube protein n=1 Tax=Paenibacillus radicibacter TaxID=2972488 RepID=UPI002159332C|nr:phage tail tube protein [Paenibacillus radicibacter]MCR8645565.1 phage tail tube protein [Paenibacillus radicibacter]
MAYLMAKDTISGQEARAYATINGRVEELFYAKKIEAKVKKNKKSMKTLGKRGSQNKANGFEGTGSMTIYYVTSLFRQLMLDYMKTGRDTYFDLQIVNEDPASSIGKQTVVIKGVNLDEVTLASFDVESEALEEELAFTFDDADILDQFGKPVLG